MGSSAGRSHRAYREAREILKREAPWICGRCGEAIDPALPHWDRMAWTAGHIVPLRDCEAAGIDPNDIGNLRPEHKRCNSQGGAEMTNARKNDPQAPKRSRVWR